MEKCPVSRYSNLNMNCLKLTRKERYNDIRIDSLLWLLWQTCLREEAEELVIGNAFRATFVH